MFNKLAGAVWCSSVFSVSKLLAGLEETLGREICEEVTVSLVLFAEAITCGNCERH